jgi:hypothetical protein
VGRPTLGKRFFMHSQGVEKRQQKQPFAAPFAGYPNVFHRTFTGLSTESDPTNGWLRVAVLRQPNRSPPR